MVHGGTRVPVCPHNRAPVVYLRAKVVPGMHPLCHTSVSPIPFSFITRTLFF